MYILSIALTMFILPVVSILVESRLYSGASMVALFGQWFVFWGVGVRLALAGIQQFFQPAFTAQNIFHTTSEDVLPLVRELGISNSANAAVGLLSILAPGFVLPSAIFGSIFYGVAGIRHAAAGPTRSRNETIAMISDLFMALTLAIFVGLTLRCMD